MRMPAGSSFARSRETYTSAITGTALVSRRLPLVTPNAAEEQRFPWEPRPED